MSFDVKREINEIRDELTAIRHDLHSYPELSGSEYRTAGVIRSFLDGLGLEWTAVGETGTYAVIAGEDKGQNIMIRADIDALPIQEKSRYPYPSKNDGVMHACGHDVHTTALLGAVKILHKHRDELYGNVKIVFQQAEESGHGSHYFIEAGLTADVDRIYGFHVSPNDPIGNIAISDSTDAASCDRMSISFKGRSSHITRPDLGADALAAAADTAMRLRAVSSCTDPMHRILVGIGHLTAGSTWNVLADSAVIDGTVRALSPKARKDALKAVRQITEQTAIFYGVSAEIAFELNAPCLVNDKDAYEVMRKAAADAVGESHVIKRDAPLGFGADDFAAFSERIKGCFAHIGTAEDKEDTAFPMHSDRIYISDNVITTGAELLVRCVLAHIWRDR